MDKKTTIYDIAKKLKITAATVSRALNNNPKISKATKQLVLKTANEMNYEQNKLAQALKNGKSFNVGVIVSRIDSNFFASIIRGIEEELFQHGYHVIICQTNNNENMEVENITTLLNAQVDGILMSISNIDIDKNEVFKKLLSKKIPLLFFDRKKTIPGISSVTVNDFSAGYKATQHLIEQGCKRIAHLSGDRNFEIFKDRFTGYQQALVDNSIPFDESLVIEAKSNIDAGKEATKKLLKLKNPPDAIFSSSDFSALGAIKELKSQNIKIPQDFCVVGFSNEPFTKFMELSISSIDQSPIEMGKTTARVFIEEVKNKKTTVTKKNVVLEPELIVRKSSSRTKIL
ncbi:LacI family DNA-binding transcriptional regulator [Wenyingzhuangia sp. IMCC45467]